MLTAPVPIEAILDLEALNLTDEETIQAKQAIADSPLISKYLKYKFAEAIQKLSREPVLSEDYQVLYAQHQTSLTIYTDLLTGHSE